MGAEASPGRLNVDVTGEGHAVDHGVYVILPTWCLRTPSSSTASSYLLGPQDLQQPQRGLPETDHLVTETRRLLRALGHHHHSSAGSSNSNHRLRLVGPGLILRSDAQLRRLTSELCGGGRSRTGGSAVASSPAGVTQLHLIDCYPYRGCLSWGLLEGMDRLQTLTLELNSQQDSLITVRCKAVHTWFTHYGYNFQIYAKPDSSSHLVLSCAHSSYWHCLD